MEQTVQKHKWNSTSIPAVKDCIYCDTTRVEYASGQVRYRNLATGNYVKKYPKCITRKITDHEQQCTKEEKAGS